MEKVTNIMINEFKIMDVGLDFMGYRVTDTKKLSYHHLLVPKRRKGKATIENGALLIRDSSHDYIHIIERIDRKIYEAITREMLDENQKRKIDMDNIKRIDELLMEFEEKHKDDTLKKGNLIIKDVYKRRLLRELSLR